MESNRTLVLLKEFEQGPNGGFAATPYMCPAGYRTIGWGHRVMQGESFSRITAQDADRLLADDVAKALRGVKKLVSVPLTEGMEGALVSFVFNVGEARFATSTLLKRLNQKDYTAAANEFERWVYGGRAGAKKKLHGLERRRAAERELFMADEMPA